MSLYATFDETPGVQIASNRGWSDLVGWTDELDIENYETLIHLTDYGWTNNLSYLLQEIRKAVEKHAPTAEGLDKTIADLVELIDANKDKEAIFITDGFVKDDEGTVEQFALEHGVTGTLTFKDGSKHRYVDGKQVKGEADSPAVPDLPELPAGTDEKKARGLLGRLWDAVGSKATEIMAKLHGAAPDIFDTAADYSKIAYASHGGSTLGTPDPFAAHLGLSSNVVAVVASHALSRASMWIRKKLGMSEAVESQLTDQERAELVAEVIAAMHAAMGVDVSAPTAEDVAKWLESRKAD